MQTPPTAPAKINLFLHAGSPRADGYHPVESLIAFADIGDALEFTPRGESFSIKVDGPFARLAGEDENNLVLRAARALQKKRPEIRGGEFRLTKNLPAGAGLGGGSSDAAAALRLLAEENDLALSDPAIISSARETGADIPVCIERKARLVSGIGEILSEPVPIPSLPSVLVWPGAGASTPAVFRAFDTAQIRHATPFGIRVDDIPLERTSFLEFLAKQNNDLTRASWHVTPHVAEADAALRAIDHAKLVRMSGSGSTVFAIFETEAAAQAAASALREKYPDWWIVAANIG